MQSIFLNAHTLPLGIACMFWAACGINVFPLGYLCYKTNPTWRTTRSENVKMHSIFYILFFLYFWSIITFAFILPWLCQDLGFSLYYKSSQLTKDKLENINSKRTVEAYTFFSHLQAQASDVFSLNKPPFLKENLRIAFVVVSVKRQSNPRYLLQVVARLLSQTRDEKDHKWKAKVVVLNADTNPSENKDAEYLENYVTVINAYEGINISMVDTEVYEKEKRDYVLALKIGANLNADYTVIIEDDALPDRDFFQKLQFLINWRVSWFRTKPGWGFLKLYYPEKWQGYGNTEIPEMILIFLSGGAVPTVIYLYMKRARSYKYRYQMVMVVLLFISSGLYVMMAAYSIGRAHLIELGKISPLFYRVSQAPGCCTPCVLYPRVYLKDIIEFLQSKRCKKSYPLDFALDDFVKVRHLHKYLASPNLVSHIGFHSSLGGADKDLKEFSLLFDP